MAKDDKDDNYKEGVDFEWVKAKNGNYKTRRFFSKKEKEAMKADKKPAKPAKKAESKMAPKASPRPAPRSRAVANIETTKLPKQGSSGRGDGRAEVIRRRADAALDRVKTSEDKKPTERKAFGVPVSNPNRGMAEGRREAERSAREAARERGGRESPLGRMLDRALGLDKPREDVKRDRRGRVQMAKGGMVQANCGASMKPDGKRKK